MTAIGAGWLGARGPLLGRISDWQVVLTPAHQLMGRLQSGEYRAFTSGELNLSQRASESAMTQSRSLFGSVALPKSCRSCKRPEHVLLSTVGFGRSPPELLVEPTSGQR